MQQKYVSAEGKTFMRGNNVIGKILYLGVGDSIGNYTEVADEDLPVTEDAVITDEEQVL